ncbi:hypothetical protein D3C77_379760 [compost metagenome]
MVADPALELCPDFGERGRGINARLADVGKLAAEGGKLRASPWFDETLEMIDFPTLSIDQRCANFDNFHICDRPTSVICGCFQIDHQPMPHSRLHSKSC